MAEFTEIGKHCSVENCNQQDFLPFKCDCCSGTFCLFHRSYVAHGCPSSGDKDFKALVCPLCKKTVRFVGSQDPNEQWDLHTRTDCNPGNYKKNKPSKTRCAAPSCRQVLGPTNTQRCARCGKETCLTHRFPDSHNCSGGGSGSSWSTRGDARSSAAAAAARRKEAQAQQARPMSLREKAAQRRSATWSQQGAGANTARATADRRRRAAPGTASSALQGLGFGGGSSSSGGGAGGGQGQGQGEQCPQCGASFGNVGALVAHVEAFHSDERHGQFRAAGVGSGGSTGGGEHCPICNSHFGDVALLVSHVETMHPDGSGRAGAGASSCSVS
eukprot:g8971.t1